MTFDYSITAEERYELVSLSGELIDRNQANDLLHEMNELIESGRTRYVFDLGGLRYLNSSGLNVLINLLTKARKAGGEVAIANVSKKVNELLLITKLNTVFAVSGSVEEAAEKLSS